LSGDGGDELFAGYTKYLALRRIEQSPRVVTALKKIIHQGLPGREIASLDPGSFPNRALRSLRVRTMTFAERDRLWDSTFDDQEKVLLYSDQLNNSFPARGPDGSDSNGTPLSRASNPMARVLFSDFVRYLPDDLLVKVDVASMANSLEVRCPFLDHILVEFAMTIPAKLKLRSGVTKYLLKEAFAHVLPDQILNRDKAGFAIPLDDWLRNDLREWTREVVLDNDMAEFFNLDYLRRMLDSHFSGKSNQGRKIWALLNFSLWHKMFIRV
jgi:asparagine synthase (glutamine-hydrolysing)